MTSMPDDQQAQGRNQQERNAGLHRQSIIEKCPARRPRRNKRQMIGQNIWQRDLEKKPRKQTLMTHDWWQMKRKMEQKDPAWASRKKTSENWMVGNKWHNHKRKSIEIKMQEENHQIQPSKTTMGTCLKLFKGERTPLSFNLFEGTPPVPLMLGLQRCPSWLQGPRKHKGMSDALFTGYTLVFWTWNLQITDG